jgi:hypothetical protein
VQVELPPQVTEHESVQVIAQSAPSLQVTLALLPTVAVHLDAEQSMLHDSPHDPEQLVEPLHDKEQLPPLHAVCENVHVCPLAQEQVAPVQLTGVPVPVPELLLPLHAEARGKAMQSVSANRDQAYKAFIRG